MHQILPRLFTIALVCLCWSSAYAAPPENSKSAESDSEPVESQGPKSEAEPRRLSQAEAAILFKQAGELKGSTTDQRVQTSTDQRVQTLLEFFDSVQATVNDDRPRVPLMIVGSGTAGRAGAGVDFNQVETFKTGTMVLRCASKKGDVGDGKMVDWYLVTTSPLGCEGPGEKVWVASRTKKGTKLVQWKPVHIGRYKAIAKRLAKSDPEEAAILWKRIRKAEERGITMFRPMDPAISGLLECGSEYVQGKLMEGGLAGLFKELGLDKNSAETAATLALALNEVASAGGTPSSGDVLSEQQKDEAKKQVAVAVASALFGPVGEIGLCLAMK